jgi:hypothetical protein
MRDVWNNDGNDVNGSIGVIIMTKEANAQRHQQLQHLDNLADHNRLTAAKTRQQWQQPSNHCNNATTSTIVTRQQQRQRNDGNNNLMTLMIATTSPPWRLQQDGSGNYATRRTTQRQQQLQQHNGLNDRNKRMAETTQCRWQQHHDINNRYDVTTSAFKERNFHDNDSKDTATPTIPRTRQFKRREDCNNNSNDKKEEETKWWYQQQRQYEPLNKLNMTNLSNSWAQHFKNLAGNDDANKNMKAFTDAYAPSRTISKRLNDLIEGVHAAVLLMGPKNSIQQTHSWAKFGGMQSRPDFSTTCLIRMGPKANAVTADHNQAVVAATVAIPLATEISNCKTIYDFKNPGINVSAPSATTAAAATTATLPTASSKAAAMAPANATAEPSNAST